MDMDEIVEAVARAMCTADGFTWENQFSFVTSASGDDSPESYLHSARVAIEAHLSALSARGLAVVKGWQPIETAPRDGTAILVGTAENDPDCAWWANCTWFNGWCSGGHRSDMYGPGFDPTQWMPLPARPSLKEGT